MAPRRSPGADDAKLWARVTATVRPHMSKYDAARTPPDPASLKAELTAALLLDPADLPKPPHPKTASARYADPIEPNRRRRIIRDRDGVEARLDLHGLDQEAARARVHAFIRHSAQNGYRAVLIITGKGVAGQGILRRFAPHWLAEPEMAARVAGVSPADQRHGGDGALYVALKRGG